MTTTGDFRLRIQRDALDMVADSPWCGVGLGSFEPVFATLPPAFRRRVARRPPRERLALADRRTRLARLRARRRSARILLLRRAWPRALRQATGRCARRRRIGAVACALHGFVDVSAHRVGTAWCGLFLFGLALPGPGQEKTDFRRPAPWGPWIFRSPGPAPGGNRRRSGCSPTAGTFRLPGEQEVVRLTALSRTEAANGQWAASVATASRGLALDPVNWQLYFQRAVARLGAGEDRTLAVQADFRRCASTWSRSSAGIASISPPAPGPARANRTWPSAPCSKPAGAAPVEAPALFLGRLRGVGGRSRSPRPPRRRHASPTLRLHLLYIEQLPPGAPSARPRPPPWRRTRT